MMPSLTPHADRLGCRDSLEEISALAQESGSDEQLRVGEQRGSLHRLVEFLADEFARRPIMRGAVAGGRQRRLAHSMSSL